ncbi:MAG TPA: MMPL family transporter [Solirubrobacteraceae bacterium]|nr:MMPL family transporter [Solirubrobacteraceae bacterium]
MRRLAAFTTGHPFVTIAAWLACVAMLVALARTLGASYSDNFALPGTGAQRATDILEREFPERGGERSQIVLHAVHGKLTAPRTRARIEAMLARLAHVKDVEAVVSPFPPAGHGAAGPGVGGQAIGAGGRSAIAEVIFARTPSAPPRAAVTKVMAIAESIAQRGALQVALAGHVIESAQGSGVDLATAIGLLAAIVVLLLTFGSLLAMGMPVMTALLGLGAGIGLIALASRLLEVPAFATELAAMVGLGVGIDYALFIVTRYRSALTDPGPARGIPSAAVIAAMNSAGRAVLFAGTTVVITLLGMLLLGVGLLSGAAIAAAIGVLTVMVSSVTLLPALLSLAGDRIAHVGAARRSFERLRGRLAHERPRRAVLWVRWSAFVKAHARAIAIIGTLVMLLLALPATDLQLGSTDGAESRPGSSTYRAYQMIARGFGAGSNGPLVIVASDPAGDRFSSKHGQGAANVALAHIRAAILRTPDVASLGATRISADGADAAITVLPRSDPQAASTAALVANLRAHVIPPLARKASLHVYIGGMTATTIDFAQTLSEKLPLFIGVVMLLSALLLLLVFRSWLIALQAAFMNVLSIGAALGIVVAVFQWGWLHQITGLGSGPIESFLPVMLFAIVFGLSMDYEVFLISRIHERWRHGADAGHATGEGLALTGPVISAAAAIMICVFCSFIAGDERVIAEFGLSLASAIFLDAVVVRCLLLPSLLHLLGERTWHVPRLLERFLPHLDIDGTAPPRRHGERPALRERLPGLGGAPRLGVIHVAPARAAARAAASALGTPPLAAKAPRVAAERAGD